jgi:hypothetical protein
VRCDGLIVEERDHFSRGRGNTGVAHSNGAVRRCDIPGETLAGEHLEGDKVADYGNRAQPSRRFSSLDVELIPV